MSRLAWSYIGGILLFGTTLAGLAVAGRPEAVPASQWLVLGILTGLTTLVQLTKARGPNHEAWHANLVFLFAGVLLLLPSLFIFLVVIPHLIEWAKERLTHSSSLRHWYIQPFNIATHIIAGLIANGMYDHFHGLQPGGAVGIVVALGAAMVYLAANHLLIGQVLVLARGITWRDTGIFNLENLATDLILLIMGYAVVVMWEINPWLILIATSPLLLIYRALMIPQLKHEARIDAKTGLWNAHHFVELYTSELNRAKRFSRPLSVIMADLDLLRNINNTYGHLAGDVVLAGIGRLIRENVRAYDIAGRFGGEEFALVLPETGLIEARAIAERIRQTVEMAEFDVNTSPTPIQATMSLGIACFPEDAAELDDLIHEADIAVYQAKLRGRNRVICATDVPHYIKLENAHEERLEPPYSPIFAPRPQVGGAVDKPPSDVPESNARHASPDGATTANADAPTDPAASIPSVGNVQTGDGIPRSWLPPFVGAVILAALGLTVFGFTLDTHPDPIAMGLLLALVVMAELLQLDLYGEGTISVSVAVAFATALIAGLPGIAWISLGIALAHFIRRRPPVHRTVFNWATHVLAGSIPALTMTAIDVPLQITDLSLLGILGLTAVAYYITETGLIAIAMSLSDGTSLSIKWREQFQWLAIHYLVLCIIGLFLGIAFTALGPPGVLVFILPVLMMRYSQKQYIERTGNSVQELKRMNWELSQANREIVSASKTIGQINEQLLYTLAKIIDARDPYVAEHAAQVASYATTLAVQLGLPADRTEHVRQAAFLHDIGKIGIPEGILQKPGKLSDEEYEEVKTHAALGAEFLEASQGLHHLVPFVKHHHEWWNGKGYPDGLAGEEIPLEARILAVCDAVEAMAADRPYNKAMTREEILAELRRCAGTQFDPTVVEMFIQIAEQSGDRFIVNSAQGRAHQTAAYQTSTNHTNGPSGVAQPAQM